MKKRIVSVILALTLIINMDICAKAELSNNNSQAVDIVTESFFDSLEYVAMCVEAEAGNQDELGKRYVADCIFNRYDTGNYKDFYEVIDEKGQFSCVSNGSIECVPSEETYMVVAQEFVNRTNSDIKYFRTKHYHKFGTPILKYQDHYFSS